MLAVDAVCVGWTLSASGLAITSLVPRWYGWGNGVWYNMHNCSVKFILLALLSLKDEP